MRVCFLSLFYVGFFPKAPGTMGTIVTLPLLYFLGTFQIPFFFFIPIFLLLTFISSIITEQLQKEFQLHDPSWIVFDETLGMMTAWFFIQEQNLAHLAALFFLFRFFDIVKIWPASYFDKKVHHGSGVIIDDIVSGVYAGLVYITLYNLGLFRI